MHVPEVGGEIGVDYLRGAFLRNGIRHPHFDDVKITEVQAGRSGAGLRRITTDTGLSFVVKTFKRSKWKKAVLGFDLCELELWNGGIIKDLPYPLKNPVIEISYDPDNLEWRSLMIDVGPFFSHRSGMKELLNSKILDGVSDFHFDNLNRKIDVPSRSDIFRFFHEPIKSIAKKGSRESWHDDLARVWDLERNMGSVFDILGSRGFDDYFSLCNEIELVLKYEEIIQETILNGDIKIEHLAMKTNDEIHLVDWNFPYSGPPTDDVAYFWFLSFWCMPYGDRLGPGSVESFRTEYLRRLHVSYGGESTYYSVERSWGISWLKTFLQMPWCIVNTLGQRFDIDHRMWRGDLLRVAWINAQRTAEKFLQVSLFAIVT